MQPPPLPHALVFFAVAWVIHVVSVHQVSCLQRRAFADAPCGLPDAVHDAFGFQHLSRPARERLGAAFDAFPALVVAGGAAAAAATHAPLADVARHCVTGVGLLLLSKAVLCQVTVLPQPCGGLADCADARPSLKSVVFGRCGDLVFSCHTAITLLVALVLARFGVIPYWMAAAAGALEAGLATAVRAHYTVDVLLGLALGAAVFHGLGSPAAA